MTSPTITPSSQMRKLLEIVELTEALDKALDGYWSGRAGPSLTHIMMDWKEQYKKLSGKFGGQLAK